jgi:DNA primase
MNIIEFVTGYKIPGFETPLITIEGYYEGHIRHLDRKFQNYSFENSKTVICPFKAHNDHDPSFGILANRNRKGVKIYHCYGCGSTGNVVSLHRRIQQEYHGITLTDEQAAKDLCRIYNIDINLNDNSGKTISRDERLQVILERDLYTIRDFENDLTAIKRQNLSLEERARQINTSVIKLSVSKKKLIDY